MNGAGRIGNGQPLPSVREDGVSHEQNRGANGGGAGGKEDYKETQGGAAMDSSKNKVDGSGRRKQTRIKQGMNGVVRTGEPV